MTYIPSLKDASSAQISIWTTDGDKCRQTISALSAAPYIQVWIFLLSIAKIAIFPSHPSHQRYADSDHRQPMPLLHFERCKSRKLTDFLMSPGPWQRIPDRALATATPGHWFAPVPMRVVCKVSQFGTLIWLYSTFMTSYVIAPTPYGKGRPHGVNEAWPVGYRVSYGLSHSVQLTHLAYDADIKLTRLKLLLAYCGSVACPDDFWVPGMSVPCCIYGIIEVPILFGPHFSDVWCLFCRQQATKRSEYY